LLVCVGIAFSFSCAEIEKGKDFATRIISKDVDEKLFSHVPDEKKDAINPLLLTIKDSKDRLELAHAAVDEKKAELDLEKAKKDLAKIQLQIHEAELNLDKMKAVQSEGLGNKKRLINRLLNLRPKSIN